MKKKTDLQLTRDSKYKITSIGSRDKPTKTSGIFRGYTVVGNVDALCVELDGTHKGLKGKIRIIPSHMIMCIDIVTARKPKKEEKEEEAAVFYR